MDRWEQVKQVFQAALERKPEERHAFLAEACGDDDALRREVTALLDSHEDSDGFLERHPLQDVSDPDSYSASESDPGESETSAGPERSVKATADDLVDKIIDGKYRIERCLGAGGMGAVYLVRRLSLNRYFALKLIRSSFEGSRPFLERFRNEARALGKLKHPNIVEVTDYGVDPPDEGSPYLVMEYLEGTTLDEMSRKTDGLPIENALTVLEQVGQDTRFWRGQASSAGRITTLVGRGNPNSSQTVDAGCRSN